MVKGYKYRIYPNKEQEQQINQMLGNARFVYNWALDRRIGRFAPSSKMCGCGAINKNLQLSDREWVCPECGVINDRDVNAAKNIEREGLSLCEHNVDGCIKRVPRKTKLLV